MSLPPREIWIVANTAWYVFNFRGNLIRQLGRRGYAVTILSPHDEYADRLRVLGARHIHLEMDNPGTNPLRDIGMIARLVSLFRKERPRILLTYTPKVNIYCAIAARLTGVPVIANVSGLGTAFIRGGWLGFVAKALYRVALRHPSKIFFQNESDREFFVREGLVAGGKTERLPGSGVDIEKFRPAPLAESGFAFLMVARLMKDKGIHEYAEAARLVKNEFPAVEFRLLGFSHAGNPTSVPEELVRDWERAGLVRYLGFTDDVMQHYAQADCVVLPSYREGCPRSLLEAASMGKPIITTDVPGCRQVVDDGVTGFLVEVRNAVDLARQMKRMLSLSQDQRRQMGLRGREKMLREFDERTVIDAYLEAIRNVGTAATAAR